MWNGRQTGSTFFMHMPYHKTSTCRCRSRTDATKTTMRLNEQLKSLYASKWPGLCNALRTVTANEANAVKPAYPFLLSTVHWGKDNRANESWYADAGLKVMVFGQETNSWTGGTDDFGTPPSPVFNPDISMEAVMGIYEDFYAAHYRQGNFDYNGTRYGTFHYGFNQFASLLNARFPGTQVAYLWNNIVKIGKSQGTGFCGPDIYAQERECFAIIREEVEILKPDLLLFLTGTYDERIRDNWKDATFSALPPYEANEAAVVTAPGINVPAYRTNHPSARLPKGEMEARYQTIVDDFAGR